ncbi:adenylate/guanylate cyclase domain-containing protein [Cupriavidus sp. AcVe19-1a]|uniref:adenylate/guanylate cyclase domain-containing protein n=1 Tax=Cupriavidus sp. AcVe19-1a TaxID=2821359 RepID=UPI001AE6CB23|nr:adenylate/guanylate cyclase domain-containing protein [Cupriavidus sp. AcVe19-1a]MBP0631981.1 adenylate/guanylate cyclase domain-containing protein [Cupriavidus sp. AcVe19-1a]
MSISEQLTQEINEILEAKWTTVDAHDVPEAEKVALGNQAKKIEATVLYADLADSTDLVDGYKDWFAAEVYKTYLNLACRLIRANGGEITAFDGDRVMAVFTGSNKNSSATKTGLQINYAVRNILNPALKTKYPSTAYQVEQAVGIDTGSLFIAKTGIRGSNDLVWVGRAANYAAKLCSLREDGYATYITEDVYKKLNESSKYGGDTDKKDMWEKHMWSDMGIAVYRSNWWWTPA